MQRMFISVPMPKMRWLIHAWLALLGMACQGLAEDPLDHQARTELAPELGREADAVMAFLRSAELSGELRTAMSRGVQESPRTMHWSGSVSQRLFAVVARPLPSGPDRDRLVPGMLQLTQMLATRELMLSKAIQDRFLTLGLTDSAALRGAILQSEARTNVIGSASELEHRAGLRDGYCIAYVSGQESTITVRMLHGDSTRAVCDAYRGVMHRRMQIGMQDAAWTTAISAWEHLHALGLESPEMCLDAARCYQAIEKMDATLRILEGAMTRFDTVASAEFFEQAGDIALGLPGNSGDRLAIAAYTAASRRLAFQVNRESAAFGPERVPSPVPSAVNQPSF